jgi:hypothetical protein
MLRIQKPLTDPHDIKKEIARLKAERLARQAAKDAEQAKTSSPTISSSSIWPFRAKSCSSVLSSFNTFNQIRRHFMWCGKFDVSTGNFGHNKSKERLRMGCAEINARRCAACDNFFYDRREMLIWRIWRATSIILSPSMRSTVFLYMRSPDP